MKKKKIWLVFTGGTIGGDVRQKQIVDSGLRPKVFTQEFFKGFERQHEAKALLDIIDLEEFTPIKKFSEDMVPVDWFKIATKIYETVGSSEVDGFVIAHGTDTLSFTSSALSFLLSGIKVPVVITGSTLPLVHPASDARRNLADALRVACDERFKGVFVVFSGNPDRPSTIHAGTRARKHAYPQATFFSVNVRQIGRIKTSFWGRTSIEIENETLLSQIRGLNEGVELREPWRPHENIEFFQIYPGFSPEHIVRAAKGAGGIVLNLYNSGTGCTEKGKFSLVEAIERAIEMRVPVFGTSQHLGSVDMDIYGSSVELKKAGVVPLRDMTHEAAIAKLMWLRGKLPDRTTHFDAVREQMLLNVCGEIS